MSGVLDHRLVLARRELPQVLGRGPSRPELDFYAQHAVLEGWSRDALESAVQRHLHLSYSAAANNFDAAIPEQSEVTKEIIKDPGFALGHEGDDVTPGQLANSLLANWIRPCPRSDAC